MFTNCALSQSNKLSSTPTVQAWPGVDARDRSGERVQWLPASSPRAGEWPATKPVPIGTRAGSGPMPSATILDFARAHKARSVAEIHEVVSNDTRDSLSLTDLAIGAGLLLATAFYPAMAWLLLLS